MVSECIALSSFHVSTSSQTGHGTHPPFSDGVMHGGSLKIKHDLETVDLLKKLPKASFIAIFL